MLSGKNQMLSLPDIAKKIKGNCCERLVKYTGQELTITGANIGLGTFKIDIGSFSNKIKEINAVPPVMMAMDNNQYLLCRQASELSDNSALKEQCLRIRLMHIMAFTQLQALLSIPAPSEELSKQILEWTKQMTKLTMQSIDLLGQQPAMVRKGKKATIERGREVLSKEIPTEIYKEETAKAEVKPELTRIMTYQGINEAQMQDALKILKE
jgi:hypothetical protein